MDSNLGKHFVLFSLGELDDLYSKAFVVVHVVSVNCHEPYKSVVVLEERLDRDA